MSDLKTVWITEGIKPDTIKWAEEFAKDLAQAKKIFVKDKEKTISAMSTSQLRKFFGEIKRIQALDFKNTEVRDSILMLKPKLAYAAGRDEGKSKLGDFYKKMSIGLDSIEPNNEKHFRNFVRIFEAIVAYHKEASIKLF